MKIFDKIKPHKKVAENYFFLTFLQGANVLIALLLYPYLIRVLGKETYGTYVFILSNIQLLNIIIAFGFGTQVMKTISMNPDNVEIKSKILSEVISARTYLFIFCGIILSVLIFTVPFVKINYLLYIILFFTTITSILLPESYFLGMQKMKIVTNINLTFKLLTIPFIFIFIKSPSDLLKYTIIVSLSLLLGGFYSFFYIKFIDKNHIKFLSIKKLKLIFIESIPFFGINAFGRIKQEAVTFIVGTVLGMSDVALWDLANKIVYIPRMLTDYINNAIFPSVINNLPRERIKKIIKFDSIISIVMILIIILFGYWAVLLIGGKNMLASYPLAIILSITIYTNIIVGCYFNFIFVPKNHYYFATKNQIISLVSFLVIVAAGFLFLKNLIILITAFTFSCILEVIYCRYLIKKYKLL